MLQIWKSYPLGLVPFTLLYLAAACIGAVRTGNGEFLFYIAVLVVLIAAVSFLHFRVGLSAGVLWGLSAWGLAHMAGGLLPVPESWPINGDIRVLYSWWIVPGLLKYDHVVHAFGFGVTTVVCWESLRSSLRAMNGSQAVAPRWGLLVLCAAAGVGFGAMNEIVEFVATLLVPQTNVGGYLNTGWDLVANLVGAVIAVVMIRRRGPS